MLDGEMPDNDVKWSLFWYFFKVKFCVLVVIDFRWLDFWIVNKEMPKS